MPNLAEYTYTYEDLSKLTGKSIPAIHQAASRGRRQVKSGFDPADLRSVVLWIFRNATDELREDILGQMGFYRKKRF